MAQRVKGTIYLLGLFAWNVTLLLTSCTIPSPTLLPTSSPTPNTTQITPTPEQIQQTPSPTQTTPTPKETESMPDSTSIPALW
jgi:hypothetical protein